MEAADFIPVAVILALFVVYEFGRWWKGREHILMTLPETTGFYVGQFIRISRASGSWRVKAINGRTIELLRAFWWEVMPRRLFYLTSTRLVSAWCSIVLLYSQHMEDHRDV